MMQQPFRQEAVPPKPVPVLPLRYCEFRTATQEYGEGAAEVNICAIFASEVIEEMSFCHAHAEVIVNALRTLKEET